ncbi:MAG: branched-chain amino acid ABC transporter permease [Alphaproteobacteria bacterium]
MARDRLLLVAVVTPSGAELTGVRLHMLRRWLGLAPLTAGRGETVERSLGRHLAYGVQQAVNALANGAVYALVAIGFTMIYAVLGKMVLAFGQVMMTGAFGAIVAGGALSAAGVGGNLLLIAVLAGAIAAAVAYSLAAGRVLGGLLRARSNQAALIASIGLAIALQEFVRLVQGAREIWLQPPFPGRLPLFEAGGFDVSVGGATLVVLGVTLTFFGGVGLLMRSRFGRAYRACVDDIAMAALVGVRVPAVTLFVMAVGGCAAGIAGAFTALIYGGVSFYAGAMIGLKALTAAIVGGIGSIGGAAAGGLLIAALETASVAWLSPAYKDIVVFVALVAMLIWRPQGLAGLPRGRGD